jgi:hypothetical protein
MIFIIKHKYPYFYFHRYSECLLKVRESTSRIMQPVIQDSTQNVAIFQKQLLGNLRQPLKTLYDYALSFINSKEEVVKNSLFFFLIH